MVEAQARASHVITIPSVKTALTDGLVELQKFESLGGTLQNLKHWKSN
jgi:hypothetical protein